MELALALPFVLLLVMLVVQAGLVVRDQILVVHAAREGARAAAVHSAVDPVLDAVVDGSGLRRTRVDVERSPRRAPGTTVTVTVRYSAPTEVPLIGALVPDVPLTATVGMRVEG